MPQKSGPMARFEEPASRHEDTTTIERIQILIDNISKDLSSLSDTADRACGTAPEPMKANMAAVPTGSFARIEQELEVLVEDAGRLVERFRSHLP